jgi:GNAT superfamily N-acetyltransferase
MTVEVWGPGRAGDLTSLWNLSAPTEPLTADELAGVCFDGSGVVLATPDGDGAVAVVVRRHRSDRPGHDVVVGHVRMVMVHPDARRCGVGRRLVAAAEQWMMDQGASVSVVGAEAPIYLWPGLDAANVPAQCLAESAGYRSTGSEINMALSSTFRAPVPAGIAIRRLTDDDDVALVRSLVADNWPEWLVEFDLGVAGACVHGAFVVAAAPDSDGRTDGAETAGDGAGMACDGTAVGFCAHSVLRTGWLGPMGTDPDHQGSGVGSALVSAVATDVMVAGLADVEISWVGPVRFYAKLGARLSRSFRSYAKVLPGGDG